LIVRNILGLSGLDLAVCELLESSTGFVGGGLHFVFGRSVHVAIRVVKIFAVMKGYKVFELRLDDFVGPLALMRNGIVADVTVTINLKG
jgi:hypothetical protein